MRLSLWPQSLFGRLLAASVLAVVLAQAVALLLIAQEREHFVRQGSVRDWTRRIAETTLMLAPLGRTQRADALAQLAASPPHMAHADAFAHGGPPRALARPFVRLPLLSDFETALRDQLRAALGPAYGVEVGPTPEPPPPAVALPAPFYEAHELALHPEAAQRYAVRPRDAGR